MKQLITLIFISTGIFISNLEIKAQSMTWQRVFGLDSNVFGTHGIQTSDGGYLILCQWDPESIYPNRTRAIKLDKFGNLVWMRNYGVKTYNSVIEDDNSNYLSVGGGGGGLGASLFKINSIGDSISYKLYGGASISGFNFIKRYYDGGYIMSGEGSNGFDIYGYVVRVDKNLNIVWTKNFTDSTYSDIITNDFIFDPNNNIVITLFGQNSQLALRDGGLLKLNPDGNTYLKKFDTTVQLRDSYHSILRVDNKYAVSGGVFPFFQDSITSMYCLLDTNANLSLRKYYYDAPSNYIHLSNSSASSLALAGISEKGPVDEKIGVRKIDYSGNIIWTRRIENARSRSATYNIQYTSDLGYLVTGDYLDTVSNRTSIYVIKCDSNVYVTPLNIISESNHIPEDFILYQNYPNPFNPNTKIKYEIKQKGHYKMAIYDIKSKLISVVFDDINNPGLYIKDLSDYFRNLSSTIYFVTLSGNNYTLTRKLIFLK